MHYNQVNDINAIENKVDHGEKFYPTVLELGNSNACVKEYDRLKSEGYILIGYSLFHHDRKMSHGILVQTGKKLGAHKVLFSLGFQLLKSLIELRHSPLYGQLLDII